jgi:hypothetical protein
VAPSSLPTSLRVLRTCSVGDNLATRFAALVRAALGLDPKADLAQLHTFPEGIRAVANAGGSRNNELQKRWARALAQHASEWRSELDRCMQLFVSKSVAEALDAAAHGYHSIVYQAQPSLRVHLPHAKCGIKLHKDADYYHQPNELNIWIPLSTGVGGTNSLYLESAPGAGDFTPFEVGVGSFQRFWGNQCAHHTVVNTSDVTRVSLDVRVVPKELHDDAWAAPHGHVCFRLGEYYEQVACVQPRRSDAVAERGGSDDILLFTDL